MRIELFFRIIVISTVVVWTGVGISALILSIIEKKINDKN